MGVVLSGGGATGTGVSGSSLNAGIMSLSRAGSAWISLCSIIVTPIIAGVPVAHQKHLLKLFGDRT